MRVITAAELKNNLEKYLSLSYEEDIYIKKNNKTIAVISNPRKRALEDLREMSKNVKIDPNLDLDSLLMEEIQKHALSR